MITADETCGMTPAQIAQYNEAERLIEQWHIIGKEASRLLYAARNGIAGIDWFDHRHHMLNPSIEFVDFWTVSGSNVVGKIPIDGTVLDLCCGDGFYDYHFYRHKAKSVFGIDIDMRAIALAKREHTAPNIEYRTGDVLTCSIPGTYDVIVCRGAIEHFTEDEQSALVARINDMLKSGGWFCGDTVTPQVENAAHKHEWVNENEMRAAFEKTFNRIETDTIVSRERTTLLWRCQKQ